MPLIVFEGIDGSGKSTQHRLLGEYLRAQGKTVLVTREPGGTALGERARALLLDPATQACPRAELFLYLTARAQIVHEILAPALARGEWIVLDRFYYSTLAYQAAPFGLPLSAVHSAIDLALDGVRVDRVFWLAIDPREALRRRAGEQGDRIEMRGLPYLERVHEAYQALAAQDPRCVTLNASLHIAELQAQIQREVLSLTAP